MDTFQILTNLTVGVLVTYDLWVPLTRWTSRTDVGSASRGGPEPEPVPQLGLSPQECPSDTEPALRNKNARRYRNGTAHRHTLWIHCVCKQIQHMQHIQPKSGTEEGQNAALKDNEDVRTLWFCSSRFILAMFPPGRSSSGKDSVQTFSSFNNVFVDHKVWCSLQYFATISTCNVIYTSL